MAGLGAAGVAMAARIAALSEAVVEGVEGVDADVEEPVAVVRAVVPAVVPAVVGEEAEAAVVVAASAGQQVSGTRDGGGENRMTDAATLDDGASPSTPPRGSHRSPACMRLQRLQLRLRLRTARGRLRLRTTHGVRASWPTRTTSTGPSVTPATSTAASTTPPSGNTGE